MIHPEHLRPPPHDHPADDWNIVEKGCQSRFRVRHGAHWRLGSGAPEHAGALRQAAPMPKREPASAAFVKSVRPCTAKNLVAFVARRGQIAQRAGRFGSAPSHADRAAPEGRLPCLIARVCGDGEPGSASPATIWHAMKLLKSLSHRAVRLRPAHHRGQGQRALATPSGSEKPANAGRDGAATGSRLGPPPRRL